MSSQGRKLQLEPRSLDLSPSGCAWGQGLKVASSLILDHQMTGKEGNRGRVQPDAQTPTSVLS